MYQDDGKRPRVMALDTAVFPTLTLRPIAARPILSANLEAVIMQAMYPQKVESFKYAIGGLPPALWHAKSGPMSQDAQYLHIGERLKAVRLAFSGLPQNQWAEKHNFNLTQWNNWEKGARRIPVECAERLRYLYGLTLDCIYLGRRDGLSERASKVL